MSMSQQAASIFSKTGEALVLESVNVLATVNGILLDIILEQHFINPTDHTLEITYTFPLPWQATLLDVEAIINQQKMVGSVYEKKQAEKKYEQALTEGNSAMLLESLDNGLWSLNLGNLASKESCKIKVHYVQLLRVEHGHVRVIIPTVIAPRYGKHDSNIAMWQQPQTDILAAYPFQINCIVQGELANSLIASPSHEIQTRFSPQGVAISLRSKAWLDRDFVLELKELAQHSWALMANNSEQEQVVLLGLVPQVPQKQHRHIKILVDCSGSMGGDRIEAAKRSLTTFINYLQPTDAFSLSRFGSQVEHAEENLRFADRNMKNFAQQWVSRLQADMGGTEMKQALYATFNLTKQNGADVLLITDGDINDINPTVNMAKKFQQRIFVVGIGSSVAEPLLRQLAEETGGACEFVNDNEPVEEAINRTLVRLGQAQLQNIRMNWPKEVEVLWQSPLPKSVFYGDTLAVYARVKGLTTNHSVSLLGVDDLENQTLFAQIKAQVIDKNMMLVLERMAANSEITSLLADSYQAQALALSLKHRLVNQLTSYCLVLERAEQEKLLDLPEQVNVKQMLAAGWGGTTRSEHVHVACAGMEMSSLTDIFEGFLSFSQSAPKPAESPNASWDYMATDSDSFDGLMVDLDKDCSKNLINTNPSNELLVSDDHWKARLSPLQLLTWIANQLDVNNWPTSYQQLKEQGLKHAVIDWLQQTAQPILGCDEQQMVKALLTLFMEWDAYTALELMSEDLEDKEGLISSVEIHSTDTCVHHLWQVLSRDVLNGQLRLV
ncbi:MAG: VIT and VWA domain-containing protein [Agitococcus sp.]